MKGLVFNIQHYAIHDGPGLRTTVFLKGCPMRCQWCHNPESQRFGPAIIQKSIKMDGMDFLEQEITGQWMDVQDVFQEVEKDRVFFQESDGGLTISGGEPLMQPEFTLELFQRSHAAGFHNTLDTCGYAKPEVLEPILEYTDLILYDIKLINKLEHMQYTGVSNELPLRNFGLLKTSGKKVIIRFPVVPGITDKQENLNKIRALLEGSFSRIDLLPYHAMAASKYARLGLDYPLKHLKEPTTAHLEHLRSFFEEAGLDVSIGG